MLTQQLICGTILQVLLLLPPVDCYDVARIVDRKHDDRRALNLFSSQKQYFPYCWAKEGSCKTNSNCRFCTCKNGETFFSEEKGCMSAYGIKEETLKAGNQCDLYSVHHDFKYIPIYEKEFSDVKLLTINSKIFHTQNLKCAAGSIYLYTFDGYESLYMRNDCQQLVKASLSDSKLHLNWNKDADSSSKAWKGMEGHLLSVYVTCQRDDKILLQSCFLFQISGAYSKGKEPVPPTGPPLNCSQFTTTTTALLHTTPSNSIDIVAAITSSVLLLFIFLLLIFLLWCRRKKKRKQKRLQDVRTQFKAHEAGHYAVPGENIKSEDEYLLPTDSSNTQSDYEYINNNKTSGSVVMGTLERSAVGTLDRRSRASMLSEDRTGTLKRPLPERPDESVNPLYTPMSAATLDRKPLKTPAPPAPYAVSGILDTAPLYTGVSESPRSPSLPPANDRTYENGANNLYATPSAVKVCDDNPLYTMYSTIADLNIQCEQEPCQEEEI